MRSSDVVYSYVSKLTRFSFFSVAHSLPSSAPRFPIRHCPTPAAPAVRPLKPSPAAQPYLSGLNRLVNRLSRVDTA